MTQWENDIEQIKEKLTIDGAGRLVLAGLPMILTPRMFFANIQKRVDETCGEGKGRHIYYQAAFESAYRYMKNSREVYDITGRDILQQYLDSLSVRGWGKFELLELAEEKGEGRIRLNHSGMAEEFGHVGRSVCHVWAGAMAGAIQYLVEEHNKATKVRGRELMCLSKGDPHCEFVVEPGT
jgi:predicted hydrocarbon binding protein